LIKKRVHVRLAHIRPSKCRTEFLKRCKRNAEMQAKAKKEAKENKHDEQKTSGSAAKTAKPKPKRMCLFVCYCVYR